MAWRPLGCLDAVCCGAVWERVVGWMGAVDEVGGVGEDVRMAGVLGGMGGVSVRVGG